jgi:hypothetical protein
MYVILLTCLLSEVQIVPSTQAMIEEMLAHVYVTSGSEVMEKAKTHFESQSPSQIRIIYRVFLDTKKRAEEYHLALIEAHQQAALNQAKLNLAKAEAYRDHLKREFQMTMQIKKQELEVLKSANRMNWMQNYYNRPIDQSRNNRYRSYRYRHSPY